MSTLYKIDKTDPKNRFVIASKSIEKGAIILEVKPISAFSLSF
jgi:hypothetical protein